MIPQKHGVSTTGVFLGEHQGRPAIFKYYKTESKFTREQLAYAQLTECDFVPKILAWNPASKLTIFQYVGQSLDIKYPPKERRVFFDRIYGLNQTLIHNYGIYHNDIRWKNVVEHDDGRLFIIDFEKWTPHLHDVREITLEKIGR
jgi:RIO-like serine/threonine protein kinase